MGLRKAALMGMLAAAHLPARGVKMIELNEGLAGREVPVAAGEQVRVTLVASGGTGYRWRVGAGCDGLLKLVEEHREGGGTKPGASGKRIWVYEATTEGSCELRFELGRSWEKAVTGRAVVFPVTVGGGR